MTELDEATRRLVRGARLPPFLYAIGPADARRAFGLIQTPPGELPDLVHRTVELAAPGGPVAIHLLIPREPAPAPRPVILYAHGGGWLIGGWATHHRLAVRMCRDTGAIVVMPEYTRVPEARHPVAVSQVAATLAWIRAGGLPARADLDRVALAGDCAGATMTLSVALRDRAAGHPALRAQVLLNPMGRPAPQDRSARQFATGAGLRLADVRDLHQRYAPDRYADPLAATDLAGLPPTLLITAEADVTRDVAERLGARLRAAGVAVTAARYLGTVHDFAVLDALRWTPAAIAALGQVAEHLRRAFGEPP